VVLNSISKVTFLLILRVILSLKSKLKQKAKKMKLPKGMGMTHIFFLSVSAGMSAESEHSEALTEKKYMSYTHG